MITVDVAGSNNIDEVKRKIQAKTNIPPDRQRLFHEKVELEGGRMVWEREIQNEPTFDMVSRDI